jgi:GH43 family beta-xylosidase
MIQRVKQKLPVLPFSTLISHRGEDPWVIFWNGYYYYCREFNDCVIMVNKAKNLEDVGRQEHIVWRDPRATPEAKLWAPELHRINGKWYIYFTMDGPKGHRMYVLEGTSDDPQGEYTFKGQITDPSDQWAIDGTPFFWKGTWYFTWSGWESNDNRLQNLYIARMDNPWTIKGERVRISQPEYQWEKMGSPDLPHVNEGPQALEHKDSLFIIYSASHSLTDDYCLGQLALVGNDPLDPEAWRKKDQTVFSKSNNIFGPGHASFIEKPDGTDWIIYHATNKRAKGDMSLPENWAPQWDARKLRAQRFTWNPDGSPNFSQPNALKSIKIPEIISQLIKHPSLLKLGR